MFEGLGEGGLDLVIGEIGQAALTRDICVLLRDWPYRFEKCPESVEAEEKVGAGHGD